MCKPGGLEHGLQLKQHLSESHRLVFCLSIDGLKSDYDNKSVAGFEDSTYIVVEKNGSKLQTGLAKSSSITADERSVTPH